MLGVIARKEVVLMPFWVSILDAEAKRQRVLRRKRKRDKKQEARKAARKRARLR